ncbi:E3 ubiquitin-protein ligase HUWE1 [Nematocida major]|uniref:E3 ubiquitin-protein ligase HUWE1 n=1 Tax=Nematocida major TaxID=1912982 RepID=UPI002007D567|nr:E3 ubiquitin-protein ligase HUWE1 [Nematocida major]KAH9385126.1 E3 ubiquitin-protein ligase HUWE1 [Nematocida major]
MKIERPIEKRFTQPPENISNIIRNLESVPESEIAVYLTNINEWRHTKTDLFYWVSVLDRLDMVLKNMLSEYNIEQFQNRPLSKEDKEKAHAILKFQKLLVENSSNKSLFSSFDVIEPFIYSFELDLAIDALYLVSFFASKIHIQRSIKASMCLMKMETLKILIDRVKDKPQGVYTYYDEHTDSCKRVSIKKVVKKGIYGLPDKTVPKQEQRRFVHAVRQNELLEQIDKLKIIRMLAFSALVYYSYTDLPIDSEFINRDIPEVLNIINTESYEMREAALTMVDSIFRMRIRHSSVISAMSAQSHEGMIMNLLKKIVNEELPEHFVVAFFNFLSSCFASAQCVSALFSAGIVQYVYNTLRDRADISYKKKMRLVMGANTFLFTLPAPFTWFISENGMGVLSKQLLAAVETVLGSIEDYDLLMYINSIMKIVSQLFKNVGTVEAMRGFLEGEFPKAITQILFHSEKFTPSILAYLFSTVSDYIHNEPSNLLFVVEAGIFEGFVMCMKKELTSCPDLLLEFPNIIEAFFLNAELIRKIEEANILDKIFQGFEMPNMCNIIMSYDIASTYGVFLENLVRHYPVVSASVKERIYNTMKNLEAQIPHTDHALMLVLLENLFRMVHRAVYRKTTNNQLITDMGLLNNRIISMLTLIEIPPDTELYTDVMSILIEVFNEDQAYVISYIAKLVDRVMKNKVTQENADKIKRILLVANYLLFKAEDASRAFIKHCTTKGFLQTVMRVSEYFNDIVVENDPAKKQSCEMLINLYYSFTLGILKNIHSVKDSPKQFLKVFSMLVEDSLDKAAQNEYVYYSTHMHGLKNYLLLDKDPAGYMAGYHFVITHDYLIEINVCGRLMEHARKLVGMHTKNEIDEASLKKTVTSILELLSIYIRGIRGIFSPAEETAHREKLCEIEEHVLVFVELLLEHIDKSSIEHLLSIVKTAFYSLLKTQKSTKTEPGAEPAFLPSHARREALGAFFVSAFLSLPRSETESVLNADIFTILLADGATFRQVYDKKCYDLLRHAAIKDSCAFFHLYSYLPEMTEVVGESTDPSFLKMYAMVVLFTAMHDTLKKTSLLDKALGTIRFHETTDAGVLEGQGVVLLVVTKLHIEYSFGLHVEAPMELVDRMYSALESSQAQESLLTVINLLVRRMVEGPEAVQETVNSVIKSKHLGKFRMYTTHTTCSNLRSTIFYSISTALKYITENFECISAGWDDIRHKLPENVKAPSGSTEMSEAALETLSDGLFNKKIKKYSDVKPEVFRAIFSTDTGSTLEKTARVHSLSLLVVAFPQLVASLGEEDYPGFRRFLSWHAMHAKLTKPGTISEEEKALAHWSGHFIVAVFNYTIGISIKRHLMGYIVEMIHESMNNIVVLTELVQEILVTRFSKNTFDECITLIKEMCVLESIISRTMEIDNRRKDYGAILEALAGPIEYITRIVSVDEKEAFYEEASQSEEEMYFEDIDEGYMEDFDTDETMDSDQMLYDDTDEQSNEVEEASTEDSLTVYTSESNNYEEYTLSEEVLLEEEEAAPEKNEFLKSLGTPSTSKILTEEMEIFLDGERASFIQKMLEKIILSVLQEKEPAQEETPLEDEPLEIDAENTEDTEYEEYEEEYDEEEYDDEESFATGEEIAIGDENGEVPELDVEVLNNLPSDILEDTVFHFYQDRIASSTEYRPISIHFLDRLREEVRSVFEEQETRYMETFAGEVPRREEKKKRPQDVPFIAERNALMPFESDIVPGFIRMTMSYTNRRHLYRIIHNMCSDREIRECVVGVLVGNISQKPAGNPYITSSPSGANEVVPEVTVKRSFEALTYLCTKSSDITTVFSTNISLLNQILHSTNKRTMPESIKLLSTIGDCFVNNRVQDPGSVHIQSYIEFLEYDMSDDTFANFSSFIKKTDRFYRKEYLVYLVGESKKVLEECLNKIEFSSQACTKAISRLVRMVTLIGVLGVTPSYLDDLLALREMPFWEHYFAHILPKEKEALYVSSLLPIFKAFIIVHTIQMHTGSSEDGSEFEEITSEPSIYHAVVEREKDLINTFIQADPDLLFSSFAGLPRKILDFDNKRVYFYKKVRGEQHQKSTVQLMVQRGTVFEDTFHQLMRLPGKQVQHAKFNIKFVGEDGVDAGGLTREWYSELGKEMFNPNYALFTPIGASYQPNHISHINPEHLVYFKFIGRIIGKAVYDEMTVDCHFTRAFYKRVLGITVDLSDVETLDPEFYRSLVWILENDIENVLEMTFSMEQDQLGITKIIDLKENGRNIALTNQNKREYVELVCGFKLVKVVERQLAAFVEGFFEILDMDLIKMFNEKELELLISGLPEIDVDDWRNNTIYFGYTSDSQVVRWYWRAVRSFTMEERAKLLQFATGTSKLPLEGFAGLRCQNGNQKFQIHKASGGSTRLPTAHTCFNQLDLPEYDTYEQFVKALLFSVEECSSGFGFA